MFNYSRNSTPSRPVFTKAVNCILVLLAVCVAVLWPRLCLLGAYPGMDEGSYAWIAQVFLRNLATGQNPPALYGFSAWPLLASWVWHLPGMPWVWFRLLDLIPALIAGVFLCLVLQRESGSPYLGACLGFITLCCLNASPVIDSGFKNSIPIALSCLFCALWLCQKKLSSSHCLAAGGLTALAVFLREPFFTFALLGFGAVWIAAGLRPALCYAMGGLAVCCLGLLFFHSIHSAGLGAYIDGYLERGNLYGENSDRIIRNFLNYSWQTIVRFPGVFICLGSALLLLPFTSLTMYGGRLLFWLACTLLPLLEPLTKIGFLYHFSVSLPGLAGFCAAVWKNYGQKRKKKGGWLAAAASIAGCCLSLSLLPGFAALQMTCLTLKNFQDRQWPQVYVQKAVPLVTAQKILENAHKGATLAGSGFAFYLYYITGLEPPQSGWFDPADSYRLSDLSRTFALLGHDSARLANALARNPPDIIAVGIPASAHEADFHKQIMDAIELAGIYEPYASIAADPDLYYGWIGYKLYRLKNLRHKPADASSPDNT